MRWLWVRRSFWHESNPGHVLGHYRRRKGSRRGKNNKLGRVDTLDKGWLERGGLGKGGGSPMGLKEGEGSLFMELGCRRAKEVGDKKRWCRFASLGNGRLECQRWN